MPIRSEKISYYQRCPYCGEDYDPTKQHVCPPHEINSVADATEFIRRKVEGIRDERDVKGLIDAILMLLKDRQSKPT